MAYLCKDCKIGFGHPLLWCPNCGKEMVRDKTYNSTYWKEKKAEGWRLEGNLEYEFFIKGEKIGGWALKHLYLTFKEDFPEEWSKWGIPDSFRCEDYSEVFELYRTHKVSLKLIENSKSRVFYLQLKNKQEQKVYHNPYCRFRVLGSNLPVD